MREGRDVAVVATGPVLAEALAAAEILGARGMEIGVYNSMAIKPFDEAGLRLIARRYGGIISLEEHNVVGGLGSAIADSLAVNPFQGMPKLVRLGLQDVYTSVVGSQAFLRRHYGLSAEDIVRAATMLEKRLNG